MAKSRAMMKFYENIGNDENDGDDERPIGLMERWCKQDVALIAANQLSPQIHHHRIIPLSVTF